MFLKLKKALIPNWIAQCTEDLKLKLLESEADDTCCEHLTPNSGLNLYNVQLYFIFIFYFLVSSCPASLHPPRHPHPPLHTHNKKKLWDQPLGIIIVSIFSLISDWEVNHIGHQP